MTFRPIVGKFVDLNGFKAHVDTLQFTGWKPFFVVVHNTSEPDLATYADWRAHPEQHGRWTPEQWGRNLVGFYENQKPPWSTGPHAFVCPDGILLFTPFTEHGTHSPSWNAVTWGIETVGEFEREPFEDGSRDNLIAVLGILHARIGLNPTDYHFGVRGIHFHKEDPKTTHKQCPGHNMVKKDLVAAVTDYIEKMHPGDHATIPAEVHTAPAAQPAAASSDDTAAILAIAGKSPIMGYRWHDRGVAPPAYINGMALTFAQTYRRFKAGHPAAIEMAKANTHNDEHDALSWYNSNFAALGMSNDQPGSDTLRHLFVLMLGHAMRESSGQHCCGRDGLFQTSYNAHACHPQFDVVMDEFSAGKADGYLSVFSHGVTCSQSNWANFGSGRGAEFQKLCKAQPAFAMESAAITLRNLRTHYGPINEKAAELRKEADDMFGAIQDHVDGEAVA
jgi:N-acetylmuramoyl-L-alanine amidase